MRSGRLASSTSARRLSHLSSPSRPVASRDRSGSETITSTHLARDRNQNIPQYIRRDGTRILAKRTFQIGDGRCIYRKKEQEFTWMGTHCSMTMLYSGRKLMSSSELSTILSSGQPKLAIFIALANCTNVSFSFTTPSMITESERKNSRIQGFAQKSGS